MAKKTSNAGLRAWRSLGAYSRSTFRQSYRSKGGKAWGTDIKSIIGRGIRRSRISRGLNPNSGKVYSAKDLGLTGATRKAYASLVPAAKAGLVKSTGVGGTKRVARAVRRRYR